MRYGVFGRKGKFMKYLTTFIALFYTSLSFAWGPLGHRITAKIAEHYLTDAVKVKINTLLKNETMPMVANYPDFIKSDSDMRKKYSEYHYLSFHSDKKISEGKKSQVKNILSGIDHFSKVLKNIKSSDEDKKFALSFIIHLIGDLHQPLHIGYNHDHGGNKVEVTWFGEKTNLHDVWDSRLIRLSELSYTEYAQELKRLISKNDLNTWSTPIDPGKWAQESRNYLKNVYDFEVKKYWEFKYSYKNRAFLDQRLKQGGVRLAAYLNKLLK